MTKILFCLPNNNSDTHMRYVIELAEALRFNHQIKVVIENQADSWQPLPWRFLRLFVTACLARFYGTKHFYVHYSFIAIYTFALVTKIFGGKIYYWNCGLPWNYRRSRFREMFERGAYRLIDVFVTGTKELGKQYANHYSFPEQKIKSIPNWIDLEDFRMAANKENLPKAIKEKIAGRPTALFVHKLVKRKGADLLPNIAQALPEVFIVVVGAGELRADLEQAASRFDNLIVVGPVPNQQVASWLDLADVFLLPSEEEGFAHVILEALAFGVPVVGFDVGATSEVVGGAGIVVPIGRIDDFVDGIKKVLSDRDKFSNIAATQVKQFTKQKVVSLFSDLFKDETSSN